MLESLEFKVNEHNLKNIDEFKERVGNQIHDAIRLTKKDRALRDAALTFKINVSNGTVTGFAVGEITHHLQMEQ